MRNGSVAFAQVLAEALPYIRRFSGRTVVIKYGGNAMRNDQLKAGFARDVVLLKLVGMNPVVVHGGGPQIGERLRQIGKESRFVEGVRVTDGETMDVVEMVLGGLVNKEIVNWIHSSGGKAVGLSGKDGGLLYARKLQLEKIRGSPEALNPLERVEKTDSAQVDLGQVGDVERVDTRVLDVLMEGGFIPVVAPIAAGADGRSYNINADLVAARLATELKAEKLLLLSNVRGLLNAEDELLERPSQETVRKLLRCGRIRQGMLPKVNAALGALEGGVRHVHIVDGTAEHAVLLEIFSDRGVGTLLEADPETADSQ